MILAHEIKTDEEINQFFGVSIFDEKEEEKLMEYKELFDSQFANLKNYYVIDDNGGVYEFIKDNEDLLILLNEIKPFLEKYFDNHSYFLRVRVYPEDFDSKLALVIKVDYSGVDVEDLVASLMKIDDEIRPSERLLSLTDVFFVTVEGL